MNEPTGDHGNGNGTEKFETHKIDLIAWLTNDHEKHPFEPFEVLKIDKRPSTRWEGAFQSFWIFEKTKALMDAVRDFEKPSNWQSSYVRSFMDRQRAVRDTKKSLEFSKRR